MWAEVADVLDKAADLIDPAKGGRWIRGAEDDGNGGYCLIGAVKAGARLRGVRYDNPAYVLADEAVWSMVCDLDGDVQGIGEWNDEHCLDGAEALNVLRKAAEIDRAGVADPQVTAGSTRFGPDAAPPAASGQESGWTDPRPTPTN